MTSEDSSSIEPILSCESYVITETQKQAQKDSWVHNTKQIHFVNTDQIIPFSH